jgi:hypothetical protein
MAKVNSSPRVQARARKQSEILADNRAKSSVDWVALRAENLRRAAAAERLQS